MHKMFIAQGPRSCLRPDFIFLTLDLFHVNYMFDCGGSFTIIERGEKMSLKSAYENEKSVK